MPRNVAVKVSDKYYVKDTVEHWRQIMSFAERTKVALNMGQLSLAELGGIVEADQRTVTRWLTGESVPQRLSRKTLLELAYVAEELAAVLRLEDRNIWIHSPNRLLGHDSPADRIREGDYRSVLALIDALADGIAV